MLVIDIKNRIVKDNKKIKISIRIITIIKVKEEYKPDTSMFKSINQNNKIQNSKILQNNKIANQEDKKA